jgi:hypothetical protein
MMSSRRLRPVYRQRRAMIALGAASLFFYSPAAQAQFEPVPPTGTEEINITYSAGAAAFANGVYNSSIRGNTIVDQISTRGAVLQDSIQGNIGIVQFNQDVGVATNQANMISIAIAAGANNAVVGTSFHGEHIFTDNNITIGNITRTATIANVLNNSSGVVQINQNVGNANVNLNFFGLALGLANGQHAVTVNEGGLSTVATNNSLTINGPVNQTVTISGIYNFSGIAQINQTAGDGNVANNVLAVNVTVLNMP